MILVLFGLAMLALIRGWFPWALAVFLTPYLFAIVDQQVVGAASGSLIAMAVGLGGVVDWVAAGVLIAMVFNPRE